MADGDRGMGGTRAMKMRAVNYGFDVVQSLNKLRLSDRLCDFTLSAQGRSFMVHKLVLAATSDYFGAMLFGPMRESSQNFVDLQGLTADALDHIVRFIYSGEMQLDFDNLVEILNAGSHLQISGVLELCSDYLIRLMDFTNSAELLSIADTFSLQRVLNHHRSRILAEFEVFAGCNAFLALSADQFADYLGCDDLRVRSEAHLYEAVARWCAHEMENRLPVAATLLGQLRYALMSVAELHALAGHWLTGRLPALLGINSGLHYHVDSSRGHPNILAATVRASMPSLALVHQGSSFQPFEVTALDHKAGRFYRLASDTNGSRDCRVATVHNFVYVCRVVDCGGGSLMNALIRFDPRHLCLQALTPCRQLRIDPGLAAANGMLYLCGGTDADLTPLATVECYDVAANTWLDLPPLPKPVRSLAALVDSAGNLYISGGVCAGEPSNNLLRYDTATYPTAGQWVVRAHMQCARRLHEMVECKGRLYVFGGIGRTGGQHQQQIPVESYDPLTDQWTLLASTLAGRAVGHFVTWSNTVLSLGREHQNASEEDVWQYDTKTDTWQAYAKTPRRMGLAYASGVLLYIDFYNETISKHAISAPR